MTDRNMAETNQVERYSCGLYISVTNTKIVPILYIYQRGSITTSNGRLWASEEELFSLQLFSQLFG